MPFLFVDYDQGAGGEYFCQHLSLAPQCIKLCGFQNQVKRTKINDVFGQEFLKPSPNPQFKESHETLYEIIPTHRFTHLAHTLLGKIYSLRISVPEDPILWKYLKHQQITKVLLAPPASMNHFIGELKILQKESPDLSWIKRVDITMDHLSLTLISKGIEPTKENKDYYIDKIIKMYIPEPDYPYDLIIKYEDLFYNTKLVVKNIKSTFNIDINEEWLSSYKEELDVFLSKT